MKKSIGKITAMLLAGMLIGTALVGCDEETVEQTTNPADTTQDGAMKDDPEWDSSAYIGLTPEQLYQALLSAEGYVIEEDDDGDKGVIKANKNYICYIAESENYYGEMFVDWANRMICYKESEDGSWQSQSWDEAELPFTTIGEMAIIGIAEFRHIDLLFANDSYTMAENTYTMTDEAIAASGEGVGSLISAEIIVDPANAKYELTVIMNIVEAATFKYTIEFQPVEIVLPDIS